MIFKSQKFRSLSPKFRRAILLIYIFYINYCLFSQYIGIACSDDYHYAQAFYMDYNGNITLGDIFPTGVFPFRIDISDNGLVLIANNGYAPLEYLTLTVLKIAKTGNVYKIKDINLGGRSFDIQIMKNNKFVIVLHGYGPQYEETDYGFSVLRLEENDIKEPPIQFLSLLDNNINIVNFDINSEGIILKILFSPLEKFYISTDGYIIYTGSNIPLLNIDPGDIQFSPDNERCYLTTDNGLAVFDIDDYNNVSLWGYVNTFSKLYNPRDIVITPDSKLILESFESLGNAVVKFRNNEDGTVQYIDKVEMERPGAMGMTPDGKYVVVGYNYTITKTDMTVLRINPDETITRLIDKDIEGPRGINCIGMYKLPETSVNEIWEMYK